MILLPAIAHGQGARYLIITHDSYANVLQPLADWKTQKGYKAKIVTLSDIGGSDSVSIRNYVVNAYNTWQMKPEYLLLVGNPDQIPFPMFWEPDFRFGYSDNFYTDVWGDFHNEILPGRFWVYNTSEVMTVIDKVMNYDKLPYLSDPAWFKKGTTIVNEDGTWHGDSIYWSDARYAHALMNNAGYVQVESLAASLHDTTTDVINAINDGRTYLLYRGLGGGVWSPPFWEINPEVFTNGYKMPVVISATCGTIDYQGYTWLNAGAPGAPKGPVGFLGTTSFLDSADAFRSALARGTLYEIFSDTLATLGTAAEAGRQRFYETFGYTFEYRSWTCLGDPEMTVRTGTPRHIQVSHFPSVWFGDTMTVWVACDSAPVERALVCLQGWSDTMIYHWGLTDHQGCIKFVDSLWYSDTAYLTVSGRNLYPHVDTISGGFIGGPYVKYIFHTILDSLGGNGNHQPNNGENIELVTWIRNYGDSTARGLSGVLQKLEPDGYYQLDDTVKHFSDLSSLDSTSTSADGFNLNVSPICPDSHEIKLKLTVWDTVNTTWISYFNIRVYCRRPFLVYQKCLVLDSLGGNNDHQVNPAENIELPVWLRNIGDTMAVNVVGIMQKVDLDPYITLSDTIKDFGTVLPVDSVWTGSDGFNVLVDSQCPDQHPIELRITITDSLDSTWVYNFTLLNHAAFLQYRDYFIDDTVKFFTPGDTQRMAVHLKNIGTGTANEVIGSIIPTDSFLTIIDGSADFGTILADSFGDNHSDPFMILARNNTPAGYSTTIKMALAAGPMRDTVSWTIYVGQRDYLVWDPDPNHSSGFVIHQRLGQLHFLGDYQQTSPLEYLNIYKTIFISLGINPYSRILYDTCAIVPEIVHFMAAGGRIYLEGGNVWCHDTAYGGYEFSPLFHIRPVNDNSGYCSGVAGFAGTFTDGMSFRYTGETSSLDRLDTLPGGVFILKNRTNNYLYGVAADHRTVGVSFEFGGLVDSIPPSIKLALADSIMRYFGISPSGGITETESQTAFAGQSGLVLQPNPARDHIYIQFMIHDPGPMAKKPLLKIYDVSGRMVMDLSGDLESCIMDRVSIVSWPCTDLAGRKVPSGIYFVCFKASACEINRKLILVR